jgi:hypothetical protein
LTGVSAPPDPPAAAPDAAALLPPPLELHAATANATAAPRAAAFRDSLM